MPSIPVPPGTHILTSEKKHSILVVFHFDISEFPYTWVSMGRPYTRLPYCVIYTGVYHKVHVFYESPYS